MKLYKLHAVVLRALAAPIVNHVLSINSAPSAVAVDVSLFPKAPDRCMGRMVRSDRAESEWNFWSTELVHVLAQCTNPQCDLVTASRTVEFAQTPLPEMVAWERRAQKSMFLVLSVGSPWRAKIAHPGSEWKKCHHDSASSGCEIFSLELNARPALAVAFVSAGDEQIAQALIWANECWAPESQPSAVFVDGYSATALWLDQDVIHDCLSRLALKGIEVFCVAAPAHELEAVTHVTLQKNEEGVIEFSVRDRGTAGQVQFRLGDGSHFSFDMAEVPFQSTLTSAVGGGVLQVTRQGKTPLADNEWWFRMAMPPHDDMLSRVRVDFIEMKNSRFLLSSGTLCEGSMARLADIRHDHGLTYHEFDSKGRRQEVSIERLKDCLEFS